MEVPSTAHRAWISTPNTLSLKQPLCVIVTPHDNTLLVSIGIVFLCISEAWKSWHWLLQIHFLGWVHVPVQSLDEQFLVLFQL